MSSATTRVLLLGGHGRVSLYLTPLLLAKSWDVVSVVRNNAHRDEILSLGANQPGSIDVLVDSLDDVTETGHAQRVLDQVKPDVVVWSAGAGGKGGAARTWAVDAVAAKAYISAAVATPKVRKFLMVSYIASRRGYPAWWNDADRGAADKVNFETLPAYHKAKVEADEHLAALAHRRAQTDDKFQAINLRPGTLVDDEGTGKVLLGKTPSRGQVTRDDVARVAVELLSRDDTRGWYDLLQGEDEIKTAVDQVVKDGWDGIEGEDLEKIYARV